MLKTADDASFDPADQEKAHARRLLARIKAFTGEVDDRAKGWRKAREYANGTNGGDGEDGLVRVNLIGSMLETVQPLIYAKSPEISVTLDEHINTEDYPAAAPFAKTLETALNTFLVKDAKIKQRGKQAVRGSLTTSICWAKVMFQVQKADDPIIRNRINDTQDNIDQIDTLIAETSKEGGECVEYEAKLFELNQQVDSLNKQVEVVVSKGLVIDIAAAEDVIVMDESCRDIDDYMQASELCHRIKITVGAFKEQFKVSPPNGAKKYMRKGDASDKQKDIDEDDFLVCVYEVWSKKDLTVYTLCEGSPSYIRDPYQPETLGERWYPFIGLQLRRVDGEKYPLSNVEQAMELQDEFNTRRTNAAEHRRKNIPVRLLNKSAGITDAEVTSIVNRSINTDVIGVTTDPSQPLQNQMGSLAEIPYNPAMYDVTDILRDMETIFNVQDAARGAINKAKTLGEAELMNQGMQSRSSEAIDVVEDWLSEIAIYSAQMLLQNMNGEEIKERFGKDSVWPELNKKELFGLVNINIRAGSTTRPNKMRERDQWIEILPIIQQTMERVTLYKQQGQENLADSTIALLDETLSRFDEKMDARSLLGLAKEDEEGGEDGTETPPPPDPAALQEMLNQIQAEKAELEQAKRDLEIQQIKFDADVRVAKAESQITIERIKSAQPSTIGTDNGY